MSKVREIWTDFQEVPPSQFTPGLSKGDKLLHQFLYNWHRIALTKHQSWGFYGLTQEMLREFEAADRGDYKGVFKALLGQDGGNRETSKSTLVRRINRSSKVLGSGEGERLDIPLAECMLFIAKILEKELLALRKSKFESNRDMLKELFKFRNTATHLERHKVEGGEGGKSLRLSQRKNSFSSVDSNVSDKVPSKKGMQIFSST